MGSKAHLTSLTKVTLTGDKLNTCRVTRPSSKNKIRLPAWMLNANLDFNESMMQMSNESTSVPFASFVCQEADSSGAFGTVRENECSNLLPVDRLFQP